VDRISAILISCKEKVQESLLSAAKGILIGRVFVDMAESAEIYKRDHQNLFDILGKSLGNMRSNFAVTPDRSQSLQREMFQFHC